MQSKNSYSESRLDFIVYKFVLKVKARFLYV